jgi:cycloeucalenol cycloisomerase
MQIADSQTRWFSANPERAWSEKFFLLYIPVWIGMMAVWSTAFDGGNRGDVATLVHGLGVALPLLLVPALLAPRDGRRWYESYWLKANLFIFIVNFSGNYFISEYFFDVLGMIYHYPQLELTADAALVGSGEQKVPVVMYLLTQATYMTYHTTAIVLMRRILTIGFPFKLACFVLLTLLLAYGWSWLETMSFANAQLEGNFRYKDKAAMLAYGSVIFGMMFIPSFPIFYFLDESADRRWNLFKVSAAGLSAAWIGFFLTDLCTHIIGTL